MLKSPAMRVVGSAVWLITALGCIHAGLIAVGHNPLVMLGMMHLEKLLMCIFGIAGVLSLIMFFMGSCCGGTCSCGTPHN